MLGGEGEVVEEPVVDAVVELKWDEVDWESELACEPALEGEGEYKDCVWLGDTLELECDRLSVPKGDECP